METGPMTYIQNSRISASARLTRAALVLALGSVIAFSSAGNASAAASYKCTKYSNVTEHTICDSRHLSKLDRRMSKAYWRLYYSVKGEKRNYLKQDQRAWLNHHRNSCNASERCISKEYHMRMAELRQLKRDFRHW